MQRLAKGQEEAGGEGCVSLCCWAGGGTLEEQLLMIQRRGQTGRMGGAGGTMMVTKIWR
jgi:hypothetical protein